MALDQKSGFCSFYFLFWSSSLIIVCYFVVQESQFWKLFKEDPAACAVVMKTAAGLVYLLACLLEPFMPSFTDEVSAFFCFPDFQPSV
jgi:methionyl-tRNA synthetase